MDKEDLCTQLPGIDYPDKERTSDIYRTCNLPKRFDHPQWFYGYGVQMTQAHPCYRTNSSEYGRYPPSPHTVPKTFYPRKQEFSNLLARAGMYRNYSLNTEIDRSFV